MKLPYILIVFFALISLRLSAQNRTCGTDHYHQEQLQDERYKEKFKRNKARIRAKAAQSVKYMTCTTIVEVPVAVHFTGGITNANPQCLEDASVAQIDVMNEDFAATNADISYYNDLTASCPTTYPASALNDGVCIEFCLARFDHPTGYGLVEGEYAITVGQESWPNAGTAWSGYMNIFVEDNTGGLGIAPLYGASNPNGNGFRVDAQAFGGPGISCTSGVAINSSNIYNLGRTATHEAGHYFGCNHTFAGCNDGDNFPDTPNQSTENYGAPDVNLSTCLSDAANSCNTQDYFFNYMDYVNDAAMVMFTTDQATEMLATADDNQWGTGKCVSNPPVASFTPTTNQTVCANTNQITYTDTSTEGPTSWTWSVSGPGATVVSETDGTFVVAYTQTGTYTVGLTVSNSEGSDTATDQSVVTVLPATDPSCDLCDYELVLWDRRANGWSPGQSLDVEIDGVTTNYTGPVSGSLSVTEILNVANGDVVNVTVNTGATGLNEMSWRLFDEQGYVVMGGGDSFGIGPSNAQGNTPPTLSNVVNGEVKSTTVDCSAISQCENVTLTIVLDNWPGETAWQILDDQGDYVYQSLGYNGQTGTVTESLCLPDGCYDLYFIDFYGDGICCGEGNGSYELKRDVDDYILAEGGEFEGSETTAFCADDGLCVDYLDVNNTISTGTYVANITLTSDGTVASGSTVDLYGGQTVELVNGFETPSNVTFLADNEDCNTAPSAMTGSDTAAGFRVKDTDTESFTLSVDAKVLYNSQWDNNAYYHTADGTMEYFPPKVISQSKNCKVTVYFADGSQEVLRESCSEYLSR